MIRIDDTQRLTIKPTKPSAHTPLSFLTPKLQIPKKNQRKSTHLLPLPIIAHPGAIPFRASPGHINNLTPAPAIVRRPHAQLRHLRAVDAAVARCAAEAVVFVRDDEARFPARVDETPGGEGGAGGFAVGGVAVGEAFGDVGGADFCGGKGGK